VASIQKRPGGQWRARYRDAAGKEHSKHCARKVDAQQWLDGVITAVTTGTYADPKAGRETFAAWSEPWLRRQAALSGLKPTTVVGYESMLRSRILPRWGAVPLGSITYEAAEGWVAGLLDSGLSASSTRQSYHLFAAILDSAVKAKRLGRNPANGVDLPPLRSAERRYLTHGQVADLAGACGPDDGLVVLLLAYTGLRWGEMAAIRARRVAPGARRIEIAEAVGVVNGRVVFGTPKTHQRRMVPVPAFLRDRLSERLAARQPEDLLFTSPNGAPLRGNNFRRRHFDRAATDIGLEGLVPHELRHTAASLAIASGASVKAVQSMLGHSSAAMTLDRYGHLYADELDTVADRLHEAATRILADSLRTESRVVPITQGETAV